jgi:hypothetical protein
MGVVLFFAIRMSDLVTDRTSGYGRRSVCWCVLNWQMYERRGDKLAIVAMEEFGTTSSWPNPAAGFRCALHGRDDPIGSRAMATRRNRTEGWGSQGNRGAAPAAALTVTLRASPALSSLHRALPLAHGPFPLPHRPFPLCHSPFPALPPATSSARSRASRKRESRRVEWK